MTYNETKTQNTDNMIAATLAHEIRNPLALIKANLQYMELADTEQKNKKNYETIYREIDRVNNILYCYMKACAPESLHMSSFLVNKLLDEVRGIFERTLMLSNIRLDILIEGENFRMSADYDKLKQVLINVVQNAKESIEEEGKEENGLIGICASKRGQFADITVSDNGAGISDEDLEMAGRPFFTKKENGCGLGISISREIVERHEGVFTIEGEENKGARVTITIPLPFE